MRRIITVAPHRGEFLWARPRYETGHRMRRRAWPAGRYVAVFRLGDTPRLYRSPSDLVGEVFEPERIDKAARDWFVLIGLGIYA